MRTKLAVAAATVAATASLSFAVNGLATSRLPGGFLDAPAAAAQELVPFEDCEELREWYVEQALPDVGPYGFGHGYWPLPAFERDATLAGAAEGADLARASGPVGTTAEGDVESSGTGTNVQEVGVDEPDRAKTDGGLVVHLRENLLVVTDVSGDEAKELGTLRLPRRLGSSELLLSGETVLVLGTPEHPWGGRIPIDPIALDRSVASSELLDRSFVSMPQPLVQDSRLLEVSLADPENPRVESDQTFGGSLVSARQYDDTVRLVLRTGHPTLDFVFPNRDRTPRQAREENRQIVRDSTIEDWLPTVRRGDSDAEPLLECADVRHPRTGAGFGTLTVLTLPAADPTALHGTAVTAGGETVYSSTDRLYLATWGPKNTTKVHAFALESSTTSYVASGKVDGAVSDRWSMDEHEGVLRVAVAHGRDWSPTDNGITVLREDGKALRVVGSVRDLGPKEEIKSVRWFDDLAIVVTFRQTDPLYTVDLSDPRRPRTLGKLKIPGFSEYLHPIGDDRLVGLGQDATMRGMTRGGQASLFDIADLSAPARLDTLDLGRHAQPAASYEPRAFTWLAERGSALVGVDDGWNGRARLVEIRVADDGSLSEGRRWPLPRWGGAHARTLPLPGDRVALVTSDVTLLR
jgi:hypothetical protein